MLTDVVAYIGHKVHVLRSREVGQLLAWAGDLRGKQVLDVAGGDGWWAAQATKAGASATCLDIATDKLRRGATLKVSPHLVEADALDMPFKDGTFDVVMSVCAIEHFDDGPRSLAEMARVVKPGGVLVMSADALTRADESPDLMAVHRRKYHVQRTYTHDELTKLLDDAGFTVEEHRYLFRTARMERLYLWLSAKGGRAGWNAAAPLAPLVALADRGAPNTAGSVVCVRARRRGAGTVSPAA
ncbi:MAG: methyltransferase domain-containing protein [Mycobacteriales bacterium]